MFCIEKIFYIEGSQFREVSLYIYLDLEII